MGEENQSVSIIDEDQREFYDPLISYTVAYEKTDFRSRMVEDGHESYDSCMTSWGLPLADSKSSVLGTLG